MEPPGELQTLRLKGVDVDTSLLETRPIRRCRIEECQAKCCGFGVYISTKQVEDIRAHTELIKPHLPPERRDPAGWFDDQLETDEDHPDGGQIMGTNLVDDPTHPDGNCCVFLRPDRKCALQVAGMAAGEHPWRFKPFYCALHPLTFEKKVVKLDTDNWVYQNGGDCQRPAPEAPVPVYRLFELELKLAVGEEGYAELAARQGQ
jgi:hypothetical protein